MSKIIGIDLRYHQFLRSRILKAANPSLFPNSGRRAYYSFRSCIL